MKSPSCDDTSESYELRICSNRIKAEVESKSGPDLRNIVGCKCCEIIQESVKGKARQ